MTSEKNTAGMLMMKGFRRYVDITLPVAMVTVITMGVFAVPAYYVDHHYETWPLLFVVALLLSMPVSLFMVYRVIRDRLHSQPQD
jgi:F0F1-type ATP synthase assembly protein I